MAVKKSKTSRQNKTDELHGRRRTRVLQILFASFCIMVVLSMILAAITK